VGRIAAAARRKVGLGGDPHGHGAGPRTSWGCSGGEGPLPARGADAVVGDPSTSAMERSPQAWGGPGVHGPRRADRGGTPTRGVGRMRELRDPPWTCPGDPHAGGTGRVRSRTGRSLVG